MKKLWSCEVRGTKLENLRTWCENSTVHGCEISQQFMGANFRMGAKFRTSSWVRIFAPLFMGAKISHPCAKIFQFCVSNFGRA